MQNITLICLLGSIVLAAIVICLRILVQRNLEREAYGNFLSSKSFYSYHDPRNFEEYATAYASAKELYRIASGEYKKKRSLLRKKVKGWYQNLCQERYEGMFMQLQSIRIFAYVPKNPVDKTILMSNTYHDIERGNSFAYIWDQVYKQEWLRNTIDRETINAISSHAVMLCMQQLRASRKNDTIYQFDEVFCFIRNWALKNPHTSDSTCLVYINIGLLTSTFFKEQERFIGSKMNAEFISITSNKKWSAAEKMKGMQKMLTLGILKFPLFEPERMYISRHRDLYLADMYRAEKDPAEALKIIDQIETVDVKEELLKPVNS